MNFQTEEEPRLTGGSSSSGMQQEDPWSNYNRNRSSGTNPNPNFRPNPGTETRNRSSGNQQFTLPCFCPYPRDIPFPRWKPAQISVLEWNMIQALTGNLPTGKDTEFRDVLMKLPPLLEHDSTNTYLSESKTLSYLVRHLDRGREIAIGSA